MNNSSSKSISAGEMWIWSASFLLESIAIIFANTLTAHIFWNQRKNFKRTSYLLNNLALADFTVGFSVGCFAVENQILSVTGTRPTRIGCLTVDVLSETTSITFLVVLSLERMHAVYWSLLHRLTGTRTYLCVIGITWLFSGTFTVSFILSYIGFINIVISIGFYVIILALLPLSICVVYCTTWLGVKHAKQKHAKQKHAL